MQGGKKRCPSRRLLVFCGPDWVPWLLAAREAVKAWTVEVGTGEGKALEVRR